MSLKRKSIIFFFVTWVLFLSAWVFGKPLPPESMYDFAVGSIYPAIAALGVTWVYYSLTELELLWEELNK